MTKIQLFFLISLSIFAIISIIFGILIFKKIEQLGKTIAISLFFGNLIIVSIIIAVLFGAIFWSAWKTLIIAGGGAFC